MIYLCHWENKKHIYSYHWQYHSVKKIQQFDYVHTWFLLILLSWEVKHFLIDLSVERRGFQTYIPCLPGWAPGCFCCLSGKRVFPQQTVSHGVSSFFRSPHASSSLNFAWHPQTVKSFITQDTHHWAALNVNCLLEIAWSLKIQACQDINFMMFKTEPKGFKISCSIKQE